MKLSINLSVDTDPQTVHRWLGLEGQALLREIEQAIAGGEEITIKLAVKKEVKVLLASTPPMAKLWERGNGNGN